MSGIIDESEKRTCEELYAQAEEKLGMLQVMFEDFLKTHYKKDASLSFRIKTVDKMIEKLKLRHQQYYNYTPQDLPDIVGFRMAVDSESDVVELSQLIEKELKPSRKVDHFGQPTASGFKANLYYFHVDTTNVEIQVMTRKMELWTNQTHDEYNSQKYGIK